MTASLLVSLEDIKVPGKTTVLVVEDHEITRKGLKMFLERREDVEIVGEAADGAQAISQATMLRPNVVLMDIGLPNVDGLRATDQIKNSSPNSHVLMLTSHDGKADVVAALAAGADGYCLKDASLESLLEAIQTVVAGRRWFDARVQTYANEAIAAPGNTPLRLHAEMLDQAYPHLVAGQAVCSLESHFGLEPGSLFAGRYTIESYVSRGGKGRLYKCIDSESGEFVALKILNRTYDFVPDLLMTAENEAWAIGAVNHPNIVSLRGNGVTEDGRPYIVMDYLDGENMEALFSRKELMSLPRFQHLFGQMCQALDAIHSRGMVHCDIKPSNIILVNEQSVETVKLVDFGLVRKVPSNQSTYAGNTHMGVVVGSPLYMSPEQCQGRRIDFASDIYSLGCVMYEALAGEPPFEGSSVFEIFSKHMYDTPRSLSDYSHAHGTGENSLKVPRFLENVIFRCLRKDKKMRFHSALELKSYLDINLDAMAAID